MAIDLVKAFNTMQTTVFSADDPRQGMRRLVEYCTELAPGNAWDDLLVLDIEMDSLLLQGWVQKILLAEPPVDVRAFWFGLFQAELDGGEATYLLYIAGSSEYDSDDETADWACDPDYFPENRYIRSSVLDGIYRFLQGRDEETKLLGEYLLLIGYAGLVLRDILPAVNPHLLLGSAASRVVAVGYDDGDFITLGEITGEGWAE